MCPCRRQFPPRGSNAGERRKSDSERHCGHRSRNKSFVYRYSKVAGKKVTVSSHFVYILLNKPKDFLTTTTDPQGRKTVQQLISKATEERVYPIGRLDRNTSGVLLFTNDGDLAQKLSHPKNEMKKVYHVGLDKPLTKQHFEKIMGGVELEDGLAKVDEMAYADPKRFSV